MRNISQQNLADGARFLPASRRDMRQQDMLGRITTSGHTRAIRPLVYHQRYHRDGVQTTTVQRLCNECDGMSHIRRMFRLFTRARQPTEVTPHAYLRYVKRQFCTKLHEAKQSYHRGRLMSSICNRNSFPSARTRLHVISDPVISDRQPYPELVEDCQRPVKSLRTIYLSTRGSAETENCGHSSTIKPSKVASRSFTKKSGIASIPGDVVRL